MKTKTKNAADKAWATKRKRGTKNVTQAQYLELSGQLEALNINQLRRLFDNYMAGNDAAFERVEQAVQQVRARIERDWV